MDENSSAPPNANQPLDDFDRRVSERQRALISERQREIIRLSATFVAIIVLCWSPVAAQAPGTPCRPMGQAMVSFGLLLFGMPVLLLRVVTQVLAAWPQKRPGLIAVVMLVAPIAAYALMQWLILGVRGIVYED
jgi:hypothetical protein